MDSHNQESEILRGIASYLSLSDVESIGSLSTNWSSHRFGKNNSTRSLSKLGRTTPGSKGELVHCDASHLNSVGDDKLGWLRTKDAYTPGLVALSPIPFDEDDEDSTPIDAMYHNQKTHEKNSFAKDIQDLLQSQVFAHPNSIRSYCLSSHEAAAKLRRKREKKMKVCPKCHLSKRLYISDKRRRDSYHNLLQYCICEDSFHERHYNTEAVHEKMFNLLKSSIFDNVPLSIIFDISYQTFDTSLKVSHSSVTITAGSVGMILHALSHVVNNVVHGVSHNLNPWNLIQTIFHLQRKAVGKTGEVIATGIQSVATGVLSKSESHYGLVGMRGTSPRSGMVSAATSFLRGSPKENIISEKMFQKMNRIHPTSKVIKYIERDEDVLSTHARKRVQRMMHYSLSLRPFVATIQVPEDTSNEPMTGHSFQYAGLADEEDVESVVDESETPFMATPKSFPPTPSSRAHVLARGSKYAENVVFLARDQLRVEEGIGSSNAQTRAMAKALREGRRLAVFNAADIGSGIQLSCGQHSASKVGNDMYSTARGMIPILRNSFVYFEMSISTPALLSMMLHHASLSIGLSTLEMPLNALVGQWNGSVGICSTGQILAGSMISPLNPKTYGSNSTVGCLVMLDDESAFETWDGVMVTANVIFNIDGEVIISSGTQETSPLFVKSMDNGDHNNNNFQCNQNKKTSPTSKFHSFPALPICVPREEELYPTVTLHSPQTEVLCRFCAQDILVTSRNAIGAPRGSIVYAVDGSVLFDTEDIDTDSDVSSMVDDGDVTDEEYFDESSLE
jgi:hypothetical protein